MLWCACVAFGVVQHVPWSDEAQAWMLAGGVSWKTLFVHSLHYEGTGGLWHAFLKVLQFLHVSFDGMRWIVAAIQAAAVAVLLRFAPFPRLVRWLLPFTFFLLYQDAVVARSYCLFAILAFPAAALLRSARPRPLLLVLLLGPMANLSVHAALVSGGMALAALFHWRGRLLRSIPAVALLLVFWAGAIATMLPAADIDYAAGNNIQRSIAKIEHQVGIHKTGPASLVHQPMANLPMGPVPVHERHGIHSFLNKLIHTLAVITYPLSVYRPLALLLVLLVILQAATGRRAPNAAPLAVHGAATFPGGPLGIAGLMPYLLMVVVFTSLYLAPRHAGMVLTGFVTTLWLTWPRATEAFAGTARRPGFSLLLERTTTVLLVLTCAVQITWSFHALRSEHKSPYSPGKLTADYLKSRGVGAAGSGLPIAGFYYNSISPLLYFDHNIYFNQPPHRYWYWSTMMRTYGTVQEALAKHPAFIIMGGFENGHDAEITRDWQPVTPPAPGITLNDWFSITGYFEQNGYHATHVFCGRSWMRSTYAELLCDTVLEPAKANLQPSDASSVTP
ncbi:hypothetical protein D1Y84_09230 [Acidipila sp. EB88]|nr:hypothetical protein D1Y84_09230 [Acidipila sp. EB88]